MGFGAYLYKNGVDQMWLIIISQQCSKFTSELEISRDHRVFMWSRSRP
jgi:hypothetical protein